MLREAAQPCLEVVKEAISMFTVCSSDVLGVRMPPERETMEGHDVRLRLKSVSKRA